ncbi:MAG: putative ABC transporter permease, partial [Ruminiclostridium sp.]
QSMNMEIKLRNEELSKSTYINKIFNIFLCFLIYSFCGWAIETIYMSIYHGYIVKRGFLIGPLCGVYGIGTILVVYSLSYIKAHRIKLFLCSSLITAILELLVGILLEKLLNQRLWNYSEKFANFMGFICLQNTIMWGVLSLFVVYLVHPVITKIINSITIKNKKLICYSAFIYLSFDLAISIYTSLKGIDNLTWLSQEFLQKIVQIEYVTSKVVYYINH